MSLAARLVPAIGGLRVIRTWAGMNTTIDGASVIGPVPAEPRLHVSLGQWPTHLQQSDFGDAERVVVADADRGRPDQPVGDVDHVVIVAGVEPQGVPEVHRLGVHSSERIQLPDPVAKTP